ncbi:MAG: cobalt ECF transporter T component CbiQ [Rhodomicrobium sp.]|nr:MAG: cobalt ECF transporter T component CbiQ [Rhodomicrobium sp.]
MTGHSGHRTGPLIGLLPLQLDPRYSIILTLLFAIITVTQSRLDVLLALLIFAFIACLLFRVRFGKLLNRLFKLELFLLLAVCALPFTMGAGDGAETLRLFISGTDFSVSASLEGVWLALRIILKSTAIVVLFQALMWRMSAPEFAHALAHLYVPTTFTQILLMMIRYMDVLRDEFERSRRAMAARGFRPGFNRHTFNSYGQLVGMMFLRAAERGERVTKAMACRGFQGQYPLLHHFHGRWFDVWFAILFVSALLMILLLGAL